MSMINTPAFTLKGKHVLAIILAFFATIIAVDVAFSVVAINSFPGEEEKRYYVQGLHYNQTLEQRTVERALGWRAAAGFKSSGALTIQLRDAAGLPVEAELRGMLRRPVDARLDRPVAFTALGEGRYRVAIQDLALGAWDLRVEAIQGEKRFSIERRLIWAPH